MHTGPKASLTFQDLAISSLNWIMQTNLQSGVFEFCYWISHPEWPVCIGGNNPISYCYMMLKNLWNYPLCMPSSKIIWVSGVARKAIWNPSHNFWYLEIPFGKKATPLLVDPQKQNEGGKSTYYHWKISNRHFSVLTAREAKMVPFLSRFQIPSLKDLRFKIEMKIGLGFCLNMMRPKVLFLTLCVC